MSEPIATYRDAGVGTGVARFVATAGLLDDVARGRVVFVAGDQGRGDTEGRRELEAASQRSSAVTAVAEVGQNGVTEMTTLLQQEVVEHVADGESRNDATVDQADLEAGRDGAGSKVAPSSPVFEVLEVALEALARLVVERESVIFAAHDELRLV